MNVEEQLWVSLCVTIYIYIFIGDMYGKTAGRGRSKTHYAKMAA